MPEEKTQERNYAMETIAVIYAEAPGQKERLRVLRAPEGMKICFRPVSRNGNLAAAFQRAMRETQARYKVYVSEAIEILHRGLLSDVVAAFRQHPDISLLGLSGTNRLLTSGFTYVSPERLGVVLDAGHRPLAGRPARGRCEDVQALDSYLLATQRDIDWRQDIVHGSLYLGASASAEYRRAGSGVAVLAEKMPPCQILDDGLNTDAGEQAAFLDEYSKDFYPLVSVIIPTYQRPDYFRQALASAAGQMYRNLDIFVTDNSHNEETKRVYEKCFADDSRIRYEHHPEYDMWGNWHRSNGYDNPEATYVNWLMDDDLFVPEKIATMMDVFFQNPDVVLVTSYRQLIDADGAPLPDQPWSKPLFQAPTRVKGDEMGKALLVNMLNLIGEPTTPLIKKSAMFQNHMGWTGHEGKYQISDFPTWLCVLSKGDVIYLTEALSKFRQHANQQQKATPTYAGGMICWGLMLRHALSQGVFLHTDKDKKDAIMRWLDIATANLARIFEQNPDVWKEVYWKDLMKVYAAMAVALSNGFQLSFDVDTGA